MPNGLMSIGMFSRSSLLSIKALRAYHAAGILVPAQIDPATGYRAYLASQLTDAAVLRRLRDLDCRCPTSVPVSPRCTSAKNRRYRPWNVEAGCGKPPSPRSSIRARSVVRDAGPAVLTHHGDYDSIAGSYQLLGRWVAEHAVSADLQVREIYLISPAEAQDPRHYRTEICWPLATSTSADTRGGDS